MTIQAASFTGSISASTLTLTGTVVGTVAIGQLVLGGTLPNTLITAGSGTSWTVNQAQTVAAQAMTSSNLGIDPATGADLGWGGQTALANPGTGFVSGYCEKPVVNLLTQIAALQASGNSPQLLKQLQDQAVDTLMSTFAGQTARLPASLIYSTLNIGTLLNTSGNVAGTAIVAEIANWVAQIVTQPYGAAVTALDQKYAEAVRLAIRQGLTSSAQILSTMT
jgi:hypothetical protein